MRDKDKIIIRKIISYIDDTQQYVKDLKKEDFFEDKKTIMACAFAVSQIGELVKEISNELMTEYKNIPWSSIRGMRNRIVHDYENVNLEVLWATINKSLPHLKSQLKSIVIHL